MSNKEHPIFRAHFPGKPLLPAFLQIDIISNILQDEITAIIYSKFIKPIYPQDEITYQIKSFNHQRSITVFKEGIKMSEIKYEIDN